MGPHVLSHRAESIGGSRVVDHRIESTRDPRDLGSRPKYTMGWLVRFKVDIVIRDCFILTFSMYVRSSFVMVVEAFQLFWFVSDLGRRGCILFVLRVSAHALCVPMIQK
jgi:hypothetical protein